MTHSLSFARLAAAVLAGGALSVLAAACAPALRNVRCSNGGECVAANPAFRYCLESSCVECVGDADCGSRGTCAKGRCVVPCKDERDCPQHRACNDGRCARAD